MEKTISIGLLLLDLTISVFAQNGKTEQDILKLHDSLDQSYFKKV